MQCTWCIKFMQVCHSSHLMPCNHGTAVYNCPLLAWQNSPARVGVIAYHPVDDDTQQERHDEGIGDAKKSCGQAIRPSRVKSVRPLSEHYVHWLQCDAHFWEVVHHQTNHHGKGQGDEQLPVWHGIGIHYWTDQQGASHNGQDHKLQATMWSHGIAIPHDCSCCVGWAVCVETKKAKPCKTANQSSDCMEALSCKQRHQEGGPVTCLHMQDSSTKQWRCGSFELWAKTQYRGSRNLPMHARQ